MLKLIKINDDIANQSDFFSKLLNEEKQIHSKQIYLSEKKGNPRWAAGSSATILKSTNDSIDFIVEKSNMEYKYGIKPRCKKLSNTPYFRFDSDGPAHRNSDESVKLADRQIPTPHFNTFDSKGREFAYQNTILKQQNEAEAIANNLDFGISLFCNEANTFVNNKELPECIDSGILPGFEINIAFDLNNIKFK